MGYVFAVLGTKGGVGKSTVSMGVSIWLSKLLPKKSVLLVDGDPHVRSAELKMCPTYDATLADVLARNKTWEEAIYLCQLTDKGGKLLYPNLTVLPAGAGGFLPQLKGSPLAYFNNLKLVFDKMMSAMRKKFDVILIDTPASASLEHLILTAAADQILYICEANDDSINSTLATARGLESFMEIKPAGVVLSKVQYNVDLKKWEGKASKIAPVLGVVPADELVDDAFRDNLPVVAAYPESPASLAIKEVAQKLAKTKMAAGGEFQHRLDKALKEAVVMVAEKEGGS